MILRSRQNFLSVLIGLFLHLLDDGPMPETNDKRDDELDKLHILPHPTAAVAKVRQLLMFFRS